MFTKLVLSLLPLVVVAYDKRCVDYIAHTSEIENCCSMPSGLPEEPFEACLKSAKQQVPDKNMKNIYSCAFDCYTKELGIIVNQTIQMGKIKEYMEKLEEKAKLFNTLAWDACSTGRSEYLDFLQGHSLKCHPFAYSMKISCVMTLIIVQCPVENFNRKSEICHALRNQVPVCPIF
ncbi:uncharacterized protein LOC129741970 [Uranotaenia lowii]|uniref:uncharacterized protein LOC129741970 n=1 Tax=Uranotaenia lowii TaxID=190385 RepID=UPI0024788737|nr:uncharacterized protein LOC129741970 [Uranotaenia lowii]